MQTVHAERRYERPALANGHAMIKDAARYLLDTLDDETRARALEKGRICRFTNKEFLIHQGDKANGIHIILSGSVESLHESAVGKDLILATWQTGDFVGGPYVVGRHEHAWSARALGVVEALHLNQTRLREFVSESPSFALTLIECLGYKGERYSKLAQVLATHTAVERLALLLTELSQTVEPPLGGVIKIGLIKQGKLAHMIGATRQAVGQALQKLQDSGALLVTPTSFIIYDRDALKTLANVGVV